MFASDDKVVVDQLTKGVALVRVTSYGSQWGMHHAPMLSIKHISNPGRLCRPHLPKSISRHMNSNFRACIYYRDSIQIQNPQQPCVRYRLVITDQGSDYQ